MRSQLETSIAERLAHLSDADMQRVAEDYARIRFPERFPRFDFRAFSPEGKSRRGWPDAWIDLGGQVDGVEATGAKDKSAVLGHLEEDLEKAQRRNPKLAGLVLVSGHPAVQPTHEESVAWRQRFIDQAGIAPDRINLVFGGGLVEELARPEFARTRIEVPGLPVTPRHFKLVLPKRGPDESRLSDFIPSEEDYALGRVHRPAAADQVLAQLDRTRCALVRGVGACGKSVLAWLLALEAAEQRRPTYLLDLADYVDASPDTGNALVEDLHRFGHPQVLFVVDNCHLNEPLAKEVVLAWEATVQSQQPRLLLLGRELHTSRGSLIDGLKIEPLTLKARQPEVRGVYLRLARRWTGDQPPPEPPPEVLDDWVNVFGGDPRSPDTTTDLIAFSAAVRGRLKALIKGYFTLSEADAIHEIRSVYLDRLGDDETRNLMRLCAMEELEMGFTDEALADRRAGFDRCNRRYGLVFRQAAGALEEHVRYRLAHAALGRLILKAAHVPVDPVAERLAVAGQHPHSGAATVGRLAATGRLQEARELISAMLQRPVFLLELGSLLYVHLTLRRMQQLGVPLPANLGKTLSGQTERGKLVERAWQTPLHFLANFLGYAAKTTEMEAVFEALAADLARPESREALAERALQTPLGDLANFLGYAARTPALRPIYAALAADLARPENLKALAERALRTPLHFLASFLGYAANTTGMEAVFEALAADLAQPENLKALAERALQKPLGYLANFLGYAARTPALRPVYAGLAADLARPESREALAERALQTPLHLRISSATRPGPPRWRPCSRRSPPIWRGRSRKALAERALQTPLDHLASFLGYAASATELEAVFKALADDLGRPKNRRHLTVALERQPLDAVVSILRAEDTSEFWDPIFGDIDTERWNKARHTEGTTKLNAFVAFQRIAAEKGRPELAEVPASRLVVGSTREHWHQPGIGLHHLSQVLRWARSALPADIEGLLERVATPEWVDGLLESAPAGGLAGNLLSLATMLEPERRRWFVREALCERISRELSNRGRYDTQSSAESLALLGAAAAIGVSVTDIHVDWPSTKELAAVLDLRAPAPDRTTIGYMEIQLWLGLREMARLRADPVTVPPRLAERILDLWVATQDGDTGQALATYARDLNAGMIAWLRQCKTAGWRLVPPQALATSPASG